MAASIMVGEVGNLPAQNQVAQADISIQHAFDITVQLRNGKNTIHVDRPHPESLPRLQFRQHYPPKILARQSIRDTPLQFFPESGYSTSHRRKKSKADPDTALEHFVSSVLQFC